MAEEVQIRGSSGRAKIRNPVAVALLPFITLGIYSLVWYYKINREMADLGKATGRTEELGDSPGKSLLAVTFGVIPLGIPAIISFVHTHRRIQATQRLTGKGEPVNGWLVLVMMLVGLSVVAYAYQQSELNKAWETMRSGGGALTPAPATSLDAPVAAPAESPTRTWES